MGKHAFLVRKLAADRSGSTVTEYAAVGALIAIAALGAIVGLAGQVKSNFEATETSWEDSVK